MLKASKVITIITIIFEIVSFIFYTVIMFMAIAAKEQSTVGEAAIIIVTDFILILVQGVCLAYISNEERSVAVGVFLTIFGNLIAAIFYWIWFASSTSRVHYAELQAMSEQMEKERAQGPRMKACPSCHKFMPISGKFCPNCGASTVNASNVNGNEESTSATENVAAHKEPTHTITMNTNHNVYGKMQRPYCRAINNAENMICFNCGKDMYHSPVNE